MKHEISDHVELDMISGTCLGSRYIIKGAVCCGQPVEIIEADRKYPLHELPQYYAQCHRRDRCSDPTNLHLTMEAAALEWLKNGGNSK